jgi:membrane fusion protein (multidrug efflux system)
VLGLAACGQSAAGEQTEVRQADPARALPTVAVAKQGMPSELVMTGTLVADRQSDLAANASGRVLSTHVERGQKVAAAEVIMRLDARLAQFSAKAAKAQSKVAKANLELAALECGRVDRLLASGTISQAEYDRTKSQCASSQSSVSAAESQAALASVQAGDSVVKAPFAGIVAERYVDVGEYVLPQTRVISLVSVDPIRVQLAVPEAEVAKVVHGQTVTFEVIGFDKPFTAEVEYMSPSLRETTRDLVVEAIAPNPDGVLKPGMFATVRLGTGDVERLVVPTSAIGQIDGRPMVWVVREGRAIVQFVRTGAVRGDRTAILSGVLETDTVVSDPPDDLVDGTRLE